MTARLSDEALAELIVRLRKAAPFSITHGEHAALHIEAADALTETRALVKELVEALHSIALCTDEPGIRLTAQEALSRARKTQEPK